MNIYVGNLNYKIEQVDLEEIFAEYGEVVSARIISDRETRKSKGFGFVEMANDDDARKAIEELNGGELDGRNIVVNEARPREERPQQRRPQQRRYQSYNR